MKLDVKRQLFARSERVKGIDFHPIEPWILTTLYSGHANIWSYESGNVVKSFELCDVPVRAGRFIARKNWIVCGSDDFQLRVLNYNTSEKVANFEAHPDYIRSIAVHPTLPYVLTASDDMTIKLWDFDNSWKCVRTFEGHAHYVMSVAINPKDTNTFASACLDRTVRVWSLGSSQPNYTLEAHETKGVNWVEYYPHSDKPYIVTTSDDRTVKVFDYTTKALIATLEGHSSNVSFATFHSELPLIISGSEDGTVKLWNSATFKLEQTLNYGLERAWCVASQKAKQACAVGFDDGMVVFKLGRDTPGVSMDPSGKLIFARNNEILTATIRSQDVADVADGQALVLSKKELGSTEVFPTSVQHSPNGRFVAVVGDGEYIIYTALALRNQSFGQGLDYVWATKDLDKFSAVRQSSTSVKILKQFKESQSLDVGFSAEGLFGGALIGVKGAGGIGFFDWQTGQLVRRIEVEPRSVYWNEAGELVALATEESVYVLRFDRAAFEEAVAAGQVEDDGVEAAFEVVTDVSEVVTSAAWVGEVLLFTSASNRLSYLVGEKTYPIATFDNSQFLLGYLQRDGRAYVADKDINVSSYALDLSVIEFQTLVLRGEFEAAQEIEIPEQQKTKVARFLEGQGYKEEALAMSTDPDHRFELAVELNRLDIATELANSDHKWRQVGDSALAAWNINAAEEAFWASKDLGSLLLLYSATGSPEGLRRLVTAAQEASAHNVQFEALWLLGDVEGCIALLKDTGRISEAVLFAQTYKPSAAPALVKAWKESLEKEGKGRVSRVIGVPPGAEGLDADEELFPEWEEWLRIEKEGGVKLVDIEADADEEEEVEPLEEPAEVDTPEEEEEAE
ncbi:uncharacterized protein PV09_03217 [Verruconis gallopava]|uniref:Coatomer subunit beta' n=1 Tax=Verruconis gallopava TaxID=253628 RepID=A0A0D1XTK2_9PEZI|nr:uncharacterized protein PV09_03217 [Verruconis gallopava]KIW06041.1 hypothetical protein PV09_03217 [Verruconis gallopava]